MFERSRQQPSIWLIRHPSARRERFSSGLCLLHLLSQVCEGSRSLSLSLSQLLIDIYLIDNTCLIPTMRSSAVTSLLAALAFTSAQQINIEAALAVPTPNLSIDPLAAPSALTYDVASATSSIAAAAAAAGETPAILKRGVLIERQDNTTCTNRTGGAGPVPSPDTSSAFLSFQPFADAAKNATTPTNYTAAFTNLHASTTAKTYLGVLELSTYDVANCTASCDATSGCTAVNIFFERTPTLNLGPGCTDAPSSTVIKCVFWGDAVTTQNTVNSGFTDNGFVVVIAGSNGYNKGEAAKEAAKSSGSARVEVAGVMLGAIGAVGAVMAFAF